MKVIGELNERLPVRLVSVIGVGDVGALFHLVEILRVDDSVERFLEIHVHRQSRPRALHFQIPQLRSYNYLNTPLIIL